jgi:hypothetical protein
MGEIASSKFKFNRSLYDWRPSGGLWKLIRSGRVVAMVVPDLGLPFLFRIKLPDGSTSDVVNLTRAKDAAVGLADATLDGRIGRFRAPRIALNTGASRRQVDEPNAPSKPLGANPTRYREGRRRSPQTKNGRSVISEATV